MSLALYRKYRSRSFEEIVGQDHVTTLLKRAIEQDKVAHAYLFTGPRGSGKTSIARIVAHRINDLPYDEDVTNLDIVEIDAASNNGVEDIRDLRERVQITPVSAKKKIYIIDEVHMLSKAAFNALLKTLEEPPEHVVFILATTDIDKVPETILSRTQRHTFKRASTTDIIKNLERIAKGEGAQADADALELIARHSDGSFRDSVSLFDQLLSGNDGEGLRVKDVTDSLGLVSTDTIAELVAAAVRGDISAINGTLSGLELDGVPARTTASQLSDYLRDNLAANPEYVRLLNGLLDVSRSNHPEMKLLTTLGLFNQAPVAVPQPVAPIVKSQAATPVASKSAKKTEPSTVPSKSSPAPKSEPVKTTTENESESVSEAAPRTPAEPSGPFDWAALIEYVRTHHVAFYSVLSKCQPELDGSTLNLYTNSAFYKKKLDDSKYKLLLNESLTELGYNFEVETIATAKPLADSQAARVAAIMGGGEEVTVD